MKFLLLHERITKEYVLLKLEERLSSAVPMMSDCITTNGLN